MNASQYPITTPYGYVPGYPLNNGFHNGVDYGCPVGTPVIVNGVTIGLSGNTGYSWGPHLHVGKWSGGAVQDPLNGGFHFTSAIVTEVNEDSTNGKFVRIQGDNYSWVYLHLSNNGLVHAGQQLQGDEMITRDILNSIYGAYYGSMPTDADYNNWVGKNELSNLIYQTERDPRRKAYFDSVQKGFACLATPPAGNPTVLKPGTYKVN